MDSIAEIAEYGLAISKIIFQIMNECNIRLKSTYTSVIEFVDGTRISFWSIQSGKQDYLSRCSVVPGNLPLELAKKFVFHLLSNRIFLETFCIGKPTFATPFFVPRSREREESRVAGFIFAWLVFATFLLSERLAKANRNKKRLLMRFSNCLVQGKE